MTITQMVNNGMISEAEGEMMANSRATEAYDSVNGAEEGYAQSRGNLNSTLEGLIQAGMRSSNDVIRESSIELSKEIAEIGGYGNLDDGAIQTLLNEGAEAVKLDSALQDSFDLVVDTASVYNDKGNTDEKLLEDYRAQEKEARNSDKPYDPQDYIEINQATNQAYYRDELGNLQIYHSPGSEEGMLQAEADSNQAFLDSNGTQAGMFDNLVDK